MAKSKTASKPKSRAKTKNCRPALPSAWKSNPAGTVRIPATVPDDLVTVIMDGDTPKFTINKSYRLSALPLVRRMAQVWASRLADAGIEAAYQDIEVVLRDAEIKDENGNALFTQKNIEAPSFWSQQSVDIVANKYFRGHLDDDDRENSIFDLVDRIADTIGLFLHWSEAEPDDVQTIVMALKWNLIHQRFSFNSPVWFNLGVEENPQCSACFINTVGDSMESILELAKTEARLFKGGSGSGVNVSAIRAVDEPTSGGGVASGPLSFMKGLDSFAGAIKSGGRTRRSAKMVVMDSDHPDIEAFIKCKALEEKKAQALIAAGYDSSYIGEAYATVAYQNANHSVRFRDADIDAATNGGVVDLKARTTGEVVRTVDAHDLLHMVAQAAWESGDPGVQFTDTINQASPVADYGAVNASNPCSEYVHVDDSACNLASINLIHFDTWGTYDDTVQEFVDLAQLVILAMETLVDNSSYPTKQIAIHSHFFRPLGLGYTNLGALLMTLGIPYDSTEGRQFAAEITATMHLAALAASAEMTQGADEKEYDPDPKNPIWSDFKLTLSPKSNWLSTLLDTLEMDWPTRLAAHLLDLTKTLERIRDTAIETDGELPFRNAQVTVLAPTGTISFMMGCATTGIEPDIALVKYKRLVGGGMLKIVNNTVESALINLGYDPTIRQAIEQHILSTGTIEGAPGLNDVDLPVFDCAFRAENGTRSIAPSAHIDMMAAVQPYLSGAISKTVNLPNDATVDDVYAAIIRGHSRGLKAIAIYRDGCKQSQPVSVSAKTSSTAAAASTVEAVTPVPETDVSTVRRRLPDERQSLTHRFSIGGHEGYVTVGLFDDGMPGEVFITMSKEGSTIRGLMDTIATQTSIALQYGIPLSALVDKFSFARFEPSGFTGKKEIPIATSIVDYIFRWLNLRFGDVREETASVDVKEQVEVGLSLPAVQSSTICSNCGGFMVPAGSCHACPACGTTSGCS